MVEDLQFREFPKMARLSREIIITEKIDGTNAQIFISEDGKEIKAGSRNQWINPQLDNHGFAKWVEDNKEELLQLGPGRHFGEWWGSGIQRGYGLQKGEKRFSLFNVTRWCLYGKQPKIISTKNSKEIKYQDILPTCVGLVPILLECIFDTRDIDFALQKLEEDGSAISPGFMKPEGIVVFHTAANFCFKKTIEKDESHKSMIK